MIEYHGWVTLRYDDYDFNDKKQKEFVDEFKNYMSKNHSQVNDDFVKSGEYNGCEMFMINGFHNHRYGSEKGYKNFYPIEIFNWIAKNGKGSYGLLHILDDEDSRENFSDNFRVWVLKKGTLTENQDIFLSPFIPNCEKEYEEKNPPED